MKKELLTPTRIVAHPRLPCQTSSPLGFHLPASRYCAKENQGHTEGRKSANNPTSLLPVRAINHIERLTTRGSAALRLAPEASNRLLPPRCIPFLASTAFAGRARSPEVARAALNRRAKSHRRAGSPPRTDSRAFCRLGQFTGPEVMKSTQKCGWRLAEGRRGNGKWETFGRRSGTVRRPATTGGVVGVTRSGGPKGSLLDRPQPEGS